VLSNNTATDTDNLTPAADLAITKTDGVTTGQCRQQPDLHHRRTNNGPSAVNGASISDAFPAAFLNASWTCTASTGSALRRGHRRRQPATTANLLPAHGDLHRDRYGFGQRDRNLGQHGLLWLHLQA